MTGIGLCLYITTVFPGLGILMIQINYHLTILRLTLFLSIKQLFSRSKYFIPQCSINVALTLSQGSCSNPIRFSTTTDRHSEHKCVAIIPKGLYLLIGTTSCRKISRRLEATRLGVDCITLKCDCSAARFKSDRTNLRMLLMLLMKTL